ncbi:NAD(P)-dependent oxidoreductase [Rhodococcus sp. CH91]|uniref:NAD(P)-dependent oxidoreductase n=1 Tax=Rhodococcus sp. CH91 TaxID=2910256 RepID=UPI001F4AD091|nr:NAD(P)H-binding protein [Rhodococcus sp. CH91]
MKITVFGTGFAGSAIAEELVARGHSVVAASRSGKGVRHADVASIAGTVYDPDFVAKAADGADVVVLALPAVGQDGGLAGAIRSVLPTLAENGARLGVVGGSAVLPMSEGGPRLADTAEFPSALQSRVTAHQAALDELSALPVEVDWFVVVPAADFGPHHPGSRRGTYRTSRSALVSDESGHSAIGIDDFAIAFADEIEAATVHRAWVTVGY